MCLKNYIKKRILGPLMSNFTVGLIFLNVVYVPALPTADWIARSRVNTAPNGQVYTMR